jgi:hypothetical protein
VELFYVSEMSTVFRTNLDFTHYTPWYDYYNEFLWEIMGRVKRQDPSFKADLKEQLLLEEEFLYIFGKVDPVDIFTIYYRSLFTEYSTLTDTANPNYAKNKKSDYYKICIKGLLLQLIQISHHFGRKEQELQYLRDFARIFGSTLTYAH